MSDDSRQLKIWCTNEGKKFGSAFDFKAVNFDCFEDQEINLESAVEAFADDFFHDHDGWEASWPATFHVEDADGAFLGIVKVEMESRVTFGAQVEKPT